MSPTARAIQFDYLDFAAQCGCPQALEDLLVRGGNAWPETFRRQYASLAKWSGVPRLKDAIRRLAGATPDSLVMLASRSHILMRFAAHLLVRKSHRVLTTDLGWPPYQAILTEIARRLDRTIVQLPLRQTIHDGADPRQLVEMVSATFRREQCDSLFFPAISHDGVRLPATQMIEEIRRQSTLRFVVIDGAQEIAHGCPSVGDNACDFYIAGTHKWLGGHYPMGIGIYGRSSTRRVIDKSRERLTRLGVLDDPLLRFCEQLDSCALDGITETVNLGPLFSAQGAVYDALQGGYGESTFAIQQSLANTVSKRAPRRGWFPFRIHEDLRSGILMLESPNKGTAARDLRIRFESQGVSLTAYDGGRIRLSLPRMSQSDTWFVQIERALAACR